VKLPVRLPPDCDAQRAIVAVRRTLEDAPPYGAQVRFEPDAAMAGWNAPFAPWLEASMQRSSQALFGREALQLGTGGTIPFMAGYTIESAPYGQNLTREAVLPTIFRTGRYKSHHEGALPV
jgi:hypothetical protein